ncbi:hypothetical protein [Pseudoduganella albidiflava]|uniref:Uncharacterized protein n=1 Tax=Pseudoduganella albidiflava TaxID=321983 RepID=A0A411WTY8_9BURK|nr:hypothetical protein [Pseudoduganella albidiflava]QBH99956.1 hypothetical protein EYF70_03180 [Pseudoduganella albidiflava]GGY55146.1 hypothetical protein GCM10007387_42030 [Pseudoduganella albidiflava]
MGDYNQAFIDHEVASEEQARALADAIVAWLVDERIIENRHCDRCNGAEGECYPAGPGFTKACTDVEPEKFDYFREQFESLSPNGLRVVATRGLVMNDQGCEDSITCPRCGTVSSMGDYWNVGGPWYMREEEAGLIGCAHCSQASPIWQWARPDGGFVMLAFEFWNWWPLSEEFIAEFGRRLGHRYTFFSGKS